MNKKSCFFARNKSIKAFLTSNYCFWLKCKPYIHNISLSGEKLISSELREKYAHIIYKWKQLIENSSKQICEWILMWEDNRRFTLSLEEALLWFMDWYFSRKQYFEVKNVLMMDLFLTNTHLSISQGNTWWTGVVWITCGLLWCFYQLFELSFWRHPFTAEHLLVSKRCNG